ncbi:HD-GYP domain-containing protein [Halopseudomonas maritima]|uniref:HD-GYP domain-containing protein n=1 Tax=Halopseudomonas maritima TaxID=2918528 RepID=UPI001EEC39A8|nr:HD-GYP domain-containing protein [Halopseudomonas maritima]UJJ31073.1 HD-GYP domain-containing protein [Halopseudomonas maritima]
MLKKISTAALRKGMFVDQFCGSWLDHPFWSRKLFIENDKTLESIVLSSITEVVIDTTKGADVASRPSNCATPDPEPAPETDADPISAAEVPAAGAPAVVSELPVSVALEDEVQRAKAIFRHGKQAVRSMFQEVRLGKALDTEGLRDLVEDMNRSLARNPHALLSVARIKHKDEYTYLHSVAVAALMVGLARAAELDEATVRDAGMAGLLHDLGKAMMPEAVLNKPGRLTDQEFEVMRQHPLEGYKLLQAWQDVPEPVLDVCLHHHEKMDGSGYPERLPAEQISIMARMGAICDVYDAITSNRPYKAGWDPSESLSRMASWQGHFDPTLLQLFVRMLGIYPVGSLVRLSSGRLGVVVEQNAGALLLPYVRVFYSATLKQAVPVTLINLAEPGENERIQAREDPQDWPFKNLERFWMGD